MNQHEGRTNEKEMRRKAGDERKDKRKKGREKGNTEEKTRGRDKHKHAKQIITNKPTDETNNDRRKEGKNKRKEQTNAAMKKDQIIASVTRGQIKGVRTSQSRQMKERYGISFRARRSAGSQ